MSSLLWENNPTNKQEAEEAIKEKTCFFCGSPLLIVFVRKPALEHWKVHCNTCGTEIAIGVMLNANRWRAMVKELFS